MPAAAELKLRVQSSELPARRTSSAALPAIAEITALWDVENWI
jgi:hypothetical protein